VLVRTVAVGFVTPSVGYAGDYMTTDGARDWRLVG
jgi:hypothetical protein